MKDHLGNTRLMFCDRNGDGVIKPENAPEPSEVTQENSYYAFGMNMEFGTWENTPSVTDNLKQYNGKELNTDFGLNWNDYGARFYDPATARWNVIDKMSEKNYEYSPYNYVVNNPIRNIDKDGNDWSVKQTKDKDGVTHVNIKYTAAIVDGTSGQKVNTNKLAAAIKRQLESSYSAAFANGGEKYIVTTKVSIRAISKESERKGSEHLYRVVDNGDTRLGAEGTAYGKINKIGGKEVNLNAEMVPNIMKGNDNNTVPHETGHSLGLFHADNANVALSRGISWSDGILFKPESNGQNGCNAMYCGWNPKTSTQPGYTYLDDKYSTEINTPQFLFSINNINDGKINKD